MGVVGAVMCVVAVLAEAGGLFNVKLLFMSLLEGGNFN